jgi:hypothetical protein
VYVTFLLDIPHIHFVACVCTVAVNGSAVVAGSLALDKVSQFTVLAVFHTLA